MMQSTGVPTQLGSTPRLALARPSKYGSRRPFSTPTAAHNKDRSTTQQPAAAPLFPVAAAAALLLGSSTPALAALEPSVFDNASSNAKELAEIIAKRGGKAFDLKDAPSPSETVEKAKDVALSKIGIVSKSTVDTPTNVPDPLPASKDAPPAQTTTKSAPVQTPKAPPQQVPKPSLPPKAAPPPAPTPKAPSAPSAPKPPSLPPLPSTPSVPTPPVPTPAQGGPSQTTLLGVGGIVVAVAGAAFVAQKNGELPDAEAVKDAAQSAGSNAASAAEKVEKEAEKKVEGAKDTAEDSADAAAAKAKENAAEAKEWIDAWRKKQ